MNRTWVSVGLDLHIQFRPGFLGVFFRRKRSGSVSFPLKISIFTSLKDNKEIEDGIGGFVITMSSCRYRRHRSVNGLYPLSPWEGDWYSRYWGTSDPYSETRGGRYNRIYVYVNGFHTSSCPFHFGFGRPTSWYFPLGSSVFHNPFGVSRSYSSLVRTYVQTKHVYTEVWMYRTVSETLDSCLTLT